VISSILNELTDKNIQQEEESVKDQEQNESNVNRVQNLVSNTEGFDMLKKLMSFPKNNNNDMLCIH
jgi:hypothetical protein